MTFFHFICCKFESFFKNHQDVALQHNDLLHLKKKFYQPLLLWTCLSSGQCVFLLSHFYDSSSLLALNIFSIMSIGEYSPCLLCLVFEIPGFEIHV